jgi:hypothetical protein
MRKTASWSGSFRPTEYKVAARLFVRHKRAPLDLVIPTTTSLLPCSELSRYGLASPEHEVDIRTMANLDSTCARQRLDAAGRGEEMGFQVEQRIWVEGKNSMP